MILGLIVTKSVLVPTSAEYFSEMGGMLHLKKEKKRKKVALSVAERGSYHLIPSNVITAGKNMQSKEFFFRPIFSNVMM